MFFHKLGFNLVIIIALVWDSKVCFPINASYRHYCSCMWMNKWMNERLWWDFLQRLLMFLRIFIWIRQEREGSDFHIHRQLSFHDTKNLWYEWDIFSVLCKFFYKLSLKLVSSNCKEITTLGFSCFKNLPLPLHVIVIPFITMV